MILNLGVKNVAYSDPDAKGTTTTGEVAEILESEYHVMGVFYELHRKEITEAVVSELQDRLDSFLEGNLRKTQNMPVGGLESAFRDYLAQDEWQKTTGHAIAVAQAGMSARFKDKRNTKKKRGARPAFVDSGLYRRSFRAWIS